MNFSLGALLLTLTASTAFGAFDATRKRLVGSIAPLPLAALLWLGQVPMFATAVVIWRSPAPPRAYILNATASVVFNYAGTLLYLEALRISPLSRTIPFLSFSTVFVALFGVVLLDEQLTALQSAGVALVVGGALLLTLRREDLSSGARILRMVTREAGNLLMLGAALMWALSFIFDKRSLAYATVPVHALVMAGALSILYLATLVVSKRVGELAKVRGATRTYVLAMVLVSLGQSLQMWVLPSVPVSLYEACKRCVGMSLSVLNGAWLFDEPVTVRKVVSIGVMAAGVILVLKS
jgi:drug/metabolite transporter (DMT)-like permease